MNLIINYLSKNQFVTALLLILFGLFLIEIRGILITLFIAFILTASLYPAVVYLKNKKLPKTLAVSIPFVLVLLSIFLLIIPLFPFFISQIQELISSFPVYFETSTKALGINFDYSQLNSSVSPSVQTVGKNLFSLTGKAFNGIFSVLTIFVVVFYLLLYHEKLEKFISDIFPEKSKENALGVFKKIEEKLGAWARGQIILSFFIGVLTFIALTILKVEFALPLALIAGILEIIPTAGPIISAVPAVIVALTVSPGFALLVAFVYLVIQLLENNLLVPKIMQKAVGLNPVVIIISIIIGGNIMGILGALLAIPFLSVAIIIFGSLKK